MRACVNSFAFIKLKQKAKHFSECIPFFKQVQLAAYGANDNLTTSEKRYAVVYTVLET